MLIEASKVEEIAPGGLKAINAENYEILLGNYKSDFYAVQKRCGHMSAPLDMGTLDGFILTCPLHHAQFDIRTGEALSEPVPRDSGGEVPPPEMGKYLAFVAKTMADIKTHDLKTFPVHVDNGVVKIEI